MDLALNNLQKWICHKTQTKTQTNQPTNQLFTNKSYMYKHLTACKQMRYVELNSYIADLEIILLYANKWLIVNRIIYVW